MFKMANKNTSLESNGEATPAPALGMFGDMSLLREIIMGPKVVEFNGQFETLENKVAQNDEAMHKRMDAIERDMNSRFDRLEGLLKQNIEQVNQNMAQTSRRDKDALSDLLVQLAEGLKKG